MSYEDIKHITYSDVYIDGVLYLLELDLINGYAGLTECCEHDTSESCTHKTYDFKEIN